MRFVKPSRALLAFTRFEPVTCVIELDGVQSDRTTKFNRAVWSALDERGIRFVLHWGKVNDLLTRARVEQIYGESAERWKRIRRELLGDRMCEVFSNGFLERCGLAD